MKETANSLRSYFIVVGALSCLIGFSSLTALVLGEFQYEALVASLFALMGPVYFWMGLTLENLLHDKPQFPLRLLFSRRAYV